MPESLPPLDENARIVFTEVRQHKAMPLFEIAAATGIRGIELQGTVRGLEEQHLVTVRGSEPADTIVSVSGSYF
jgi:hypothetical protein